MLPCASEPNQEENATLSNGFGKKQMIDRSESALKYKPGIPYCIKTYGRILLHMQQPT